MKSTLFAGILAAALPCVAVAVGTLEVSAATTTRVYLDGEFVGETPLVLSSLQPGAYQVQAEDGVSGELRTYMFHVPATVDVSKAMDVSGPGFAPSPAPAPVSQRVVYAPAPQPVTYTQVYSAPRVTYSRAPRSWGTTTYPPAVTVSSGRSQREKAKVHTRNALLGATVASQVFGGSSRDRNRFRNVGLGLGLLNEILR